MVAIRSQFFSVISAAASMRFLVLEILTAISVIFNLSLLMISFASMSSQGFLPYHLLSLFAVLFFSLRDFFILYYFRKVSRAFLGMALLACHALDRSPC